MRACPCVQVDTFNDGMINSIMSKALFIIFMLLVGVVSLNALIAFLGDSYAKVQERQVEASLSLKASLIVGARESWSARRIARRVAR